MMERSRFLAGFGAILLLVSPLSVQAGMYKWYDEEGKVHYSQSPPPKGGRSAPINTDTFNAIEMRKVPVSSSATKSYRPRSRTVTTKRTGRRCSRRR